MTVVLEIVAVVLTAVTMALSLAHVLEWPGKIRLARDEYLAVQAIYYPGFTIGGAAEPMSAVALAVLLALTPTGTAAFGLTAGALAASVLTHIFYWMLTAPVNRVWVKDLKLSGSARRFFGTSETGNAEDWTRLRDRWERSHAFRAATAALAFLLIVVRTAL